MHALRSAASAAATDRRRNDARERRRDDARERRARALSLRAHDRRRLHQDQEQLHSHSHSHSQFVCACDVSDCPLCVALSPPAPIAATALAEQVELVRLQLQSGAEGDEGGEDERSDEVAAFQEPQTPDERLLGLMSAAVEVCAGQFHLCDSCRRLRDGALAILGDLVAGSEAQTAAAIGAGALSAFQCALQDERTQVDAAWALSNVAAGSRAQVHALVDRLALMNSVIELARFDARASARLRHELAFVIAHALMGSDALRVGELIRRGAFSCVAALLHARAQTAPEALDVLLRALLCVLRLAASLSAERLDADWVRRELATSLCEDAVRALQLHAERRVRDCAARIVDGLSVDDDDQSAGSQSDESEESDLYAESEQR